MPQALVCVDGVLCSLVPDNEKVNEGLKIVKTASTAAQILADSYFRVHTSITGKLRSFEISFTT